MREHVVTIAKGRARPFWFGCPVVFSGAVAAVDSAPGAGDLVTLVDERGALIGRGFYNPASSYRVRLVGGPADEADPGTLIRNRIARAWDLRRAMGLPGSATSIFRMVNSEGDGLSGLTIDVFDGRAVVMESAVWASMHRADVAAAVRSCLGSDAPVCFRVVEQVRALEGIASRDEGALSGEPVEVLENGVRFVTRPGQGQKTGFYADQRENRHDMRVFAAGAEVLDLFCCSGGFGINLALAGAVSVTGVDSSAEAIRTATENAGINGVSDKVRFVRDDVSRYIEGSQTFDVVICDPPKLAVGRQSLDAAMKHYQRLNVAAMKAIRPGGILMTCSCSSVVRRDAFVEMLRDAAGYAGRQVSILKVAGAAPDHPVNPSWPEGEYLKAVTLSVGGSTR